MKAGMADIGFILSDSGIEPIVPSSWTVKGDLHDMVPLHHDAARSGFVVHDLGRHSKTSLLRPSRNTMPATGMSVLPTITMPNMGKTIEAFIDEDLATP